MSTRCWEISSFDQGGLENARYQVELAKSLGYGEKGDYKKLFEQIEEIEEKTEGDKAGKGFFDNIKTSLKELKQSVLD